MKPSWSSWTNCDRASGREKYQAATGLQPPGACGPERDYFGALNFQSALEPARVADTATASGLTDPPVAVAGNFERRAA